MRNGLNRWLERTISPAPDVRSSPPEAPGELPLCDRYNEHDSRVEADRETADIQATVDELRDTHRH